MKPFFRPLPGDAVPRTFRRDSRLFLSVALLLILFVNLVTLRLLSGATLWGSRQAEQRASEIVTRAGSSGKSADRVARAAAEPGVLFAALYDVQGRRLSGSGRDFEPPAALPAARPAPGRVSIEWRQNPPLLLAVGRAGEGYVCVGLDAGPGPALRTEAHALELFVPAAGAALVVLAWLYLRSLLAPYERLLAAAGSAPPGVPRERDSPADERDFLIARFESTVAALSEKERELARLARLEKERADDLEIASRTLARNLPTGLLSVDPDGTITELNESGREILGISGEARGRESASVLGGIPELFDLISRVLSSRDPVIRREVEWRRAGEERVIGVTATPAVGGNGRFLGVLALFSDVSEVRRLEARVALARHLADLGKVSAGAAHEFRNAAATIDGFADLAQRYPDRAAEHLKAIRREAQEMSRVTSDFLLFARPEGFPRESVDLAAVADSAVAEAQRAFPEIVVARSGHFPQVAGSSVLLRRAVSNLLRNAAEATPRERRRESDAIALVGEAEGGEAILSVRDRGEGVPSSEREKIFLPFYSTKPDGVGFGLAIVARIAELHAGTVEVVDRQGGGAVFTLRLPSRGNENEAYDVSRRDGVTKGNEK